MRDPIQAGTGQRYTRRNLETVGTVGTVGTASNGAACSGSHHRERSGNGWEHNSSCEHKGAGSYACVLDLFPRKNGVGTCSPSGTRMVTGCSHVHTVPTKYERYMCCVTGESGEAFA